jgi:phosphatidylglycerol:prolipoprotein diacylglycerol transferase
MDPVCFHIGSHPIYWYGVMMALAFVAGLLHWQWLGHRSGRDVALAGDLAFWLMVGGILGARTAYVLSNLDYYLAAPREIIRVDQGGLIFYGGFIGGAIMFLVLARWRRIKVLDLADFTITALPLGHAFGRIGCFLNSCCGGAPATHPSLLTGGLAHYPVQLYEAAFNLGVYALLTWYYLRRRNQRHGSVLALYLMTYPIIRFLLEFLRGDDRLRVGALDAAQIISLSLIATGLALWWYLAIRRTHRDQHPRV